MRFWQTIRLFLAAAWLADVPWPLRIVRGILVLLLVFGLVAAVAWLGFGRNAEKEAVDLGEGIIAIVLIISLPLLLFGLIAVPFHRWVRRKTIDALTAQDPDHPKT